MEIDHNEIAKSNIVSKVRMRGFPKMLTYSFSDIGSDSLYHHLYQCIKNDIVAGTLEPGYKLPSKRTFAKNLGVSNITVENAYAQLQSEGYIYSIPKKGFFVTKLSDITPSQLALQPQNHSDYSFITSQQLYQADFVSNQTVPDNFPFSVWAKLIRETISERQKELMQTSPSGGILELRAAICEYLKDFRNMQVAPEQIIIGAGTEYLYGLLIQLLGHDKIYAIENPGYQKIAKIYKNNCISFHPIPVLADGIDLDALEAVCADVAHISPSHHFPTGIVTPISKRYELLAWASRKESRYIIEDDYDSEFRLSGKPIPTMQSIDASEKVIYMNTFTKSLSSTIRISYMVLPHHLLNAFYQKLGFYSCTVSNFEQYTLARFLSENYFEKHINRMRTYYRGIRDALLTAIKKSPLSSLCNISEEDAGLHFLMQVTTNQSDDELISHAKNCGLRISCLSQYYYDESLPIPEHILVLNYSNLTIDTVNDAVTLLCKCLM